MTINYVFLFTLSAFHLTLWFILNFPYRFLHSF